MKKKPEGEQESEDGKESEGDKELEGGKEPEGGKESLLQPRPGTFLAWLAGPPVPESVPA